MAVQDNKWVQRRIHRNFRRVLKSSKLLSNAYLTWHNVDQNGNYLCPTLTGRLGNLMFIVSSSYVLAERLNKTLMLSNEAKELYGAISHNVGSDVVFVDAFKICALFTKVFRTYRNAVDNKMVKLLEVRNGSVGVFSYFQSYLNFKHKEEDIRRLFHFNHDIIKQAQDALWEAVENTYTTIHADEITFIGIHIRRGDILRQHSKYGYNPATVSFLRKAMLYFIKRYRHPLFIVKSLDIRWTVTALRHARKQLPSVHYYFSPRDSPIVDMATLAQCNHSIITVGTFSWWTGWLTGGTVIYFKNAARRWTDYEFFLRRGTYYPPHWIGMSWGTMVMLAIFGAQIGSMFSLFVIREYRILKCLTVLNFFNS